MDLIRSTATDPGALIADAYLAKTPGAELALLPGWTVHLMPASHDVRRDAPEQTAAVLAGLIRTVQTQFHNRAVGTVLGDAITVQVQGPDIAAAVLTAILAAIGIHHVAATEAQERRREIGTLLATGWSPTTLSRPESGGNGFAPFGKKYSSMCD